MQRVSFEPEDFPPESYLNNYVNQMLQTNSCYETLYESINGNLTDNMFSHESPPNVHGTVNQNRFQDQPAEFVDGSSNRRSSTTALANQNCSNSGSTLSLNSGTKSIKPLPPSAINAQEFVPKATSNNSHNLPALSEFDADSSAAQLAQFQEFQQAAPLMYGLPFQGQMKEGSPLFATFLPQAPAEPFAAIPGPSIRPLIHAARLPFHRAMPLRAPFLPHLINALPGAGVRRHFVNPTTSSLQSFGPRIPSGYSANITTFNAPGMTAGIPAIVLKKKRKKKNKQKRGDQPEDVSSRGVDHWKADVTSKADSEAGTQEAANDELNRAQSEEAEEPFNSERRRSEPDLTRNQNQIDGALNFPKDLDLLQSTAPALSRTTTLADCFLVTSCPDLSEAQRNLLLLESQFYAEEEDDSYPLSSGAIRQDHNQDLPKDSALHQGAATSEKLLITRSQQGELMIAVGSTPVQHSEMPSMTNGFTANHSVHSNGHALPAPSNPSDIHSLNPVVKTALLTEVLNDGTRICSPAVKALDLQVRREMQRDGKLPPAAKRQGGRNDSEEDSSADEDEDEIFDKLVSNALIHKASGPVVQGNSNANKPSAVFSTVLPASTVGRSLFEEFEERRLLDQSRPLLNETNGLGNTDGSKPATLVATATAKGLVAKGSSNIRTEISKKDDKDVQPSFADCYKDKKSGMSITINSLDLEDNDLEFIDDDAEIFLSRNLRPPMRRYSESDMFGEECGDKVPLKQPQTRTCCSLM